MSIKSNPLWLKLEAIRELCQGRSYVYKEHTDEFEWHENDLTSKPTDEEIETKRQELISGYGIKLLREERNWKLTETDWWCCSDRNPTQAQLDYRTALRDLPANSTPSLDENGNLTGVDWPNKPE